MPAPPISLDIVRVFSGYGTRPSRRDGSLRLHAGLDVGSRDPRVRNAPVFAIEDGVVELIGRNEETRTPGMRGYGNAVVIRHPDGHWSLYAHLSEVAVAQGATVRAGQRIGRVGNSTNGRFSPMPGQSEAAWRAQARAQGYMAGPMAPHLHIEVRRAKPDGSSPFPGIYPQTPAQAPYSVDPAVWLRSKGIEVSRSQMTLTRGGLADRTRASWEPAQRQASAMAGLFGLGTEKESPSIAPSPDASAIEENAYEPVQFEFDRRMGWSAPQWGLLIAGTLVLVGGIVAWGVKEVRAQ